MSASSGCSHEPFLSTKYKNTSQGTTNIHLFLKGVTGYKKFNMSQMNPKEVFHNTAYSAQLPYIAGHSL